MPENKSKSRYKIVEEPVGDTSEAIVNEATRLGPDASNPEIVEAVEEGDYTNEDGDSISTSSSWVSRVRNKHLEVIDDGDEADTSEDTEGQIEDGENGKETKDGEEVKGAGEPTTTPQERRPVTGGGRA